MVQPYSVILHPIAWPAGNLTGSAILSSEKDRYRKLVHPLHTPREIAFTRVPSPQTYPP